MLSVALHLVTSRLRPQQRENPLTHIAAWDSQQRETGALSHVETNRQGSSPGFSRHDASERGIPLSIQSALARQPMLHPTSIAIGDPSQPTSRAGTETQLPAKSFVIPTE